MGCFNVPCMVTKLPILHGEKVVGIPLLMAGAGSICYPLAYAQPQGFFFEGEYNDYGAMENMSGEFLDETVSLIGKYMTPKAAEHTWEPEVTPDGLTMEKVFEHAHRDRITFKDFDYNLKCGVEVPIKIAMIKKGVFDAIMNDYDPEDWKGKKFSQEFSDKIDAWKEDLVNKGEEYLKKYSLSYACLMNEAPYTREQGSAMFGNFLELRQGMGEALTSGDTTKFEYYKRGLYQITKMNLFLMDTNGVWINPAGRGQEVDTKPYKLLTDMVQSEIKKINTRWGDEENEEEI
jgi:hypothetical protein